MDDRTPSGCARLWRGIGPKSNMSQDIHILTANCGSSSLRFAVYGLGPVERRLVFARYEGIGLGQGRCLVQGEGGKLLFESLFSIADHETAARRFLEWLGSQSFGCCIDGVGHRVVHGGTRSTEPVMITPGIEEELGAVGQLVPGHLPPEIRAMRVVKDSFPNLPHVACFDTSFHRQMPPVARMHPLPRELSEQGIVRFGFHGLAHESILQQLAQEAGAAAAEGRIVIAHLGSSASMAAIAGGRSIDTTMGFVANGGLMMGTRSGDLCPGVVLHLLLGKNLSAAEVGELVNCQSGLLGVSGVSRDMRELLKVAATNPRAAEAIELFCYTAKKHLGSLAAVLGGLDTLIFSGGIGENAPAVRRRICEQTDFLGIHLDPSRNRQSSSIISADDSRVTVRVMPANEELVIARAAGRVVRSRSESARAALTL
jgi:acetate kinase